MRDWPAHPFLVILGVNMLMVTPGIPGISRHDFG